MKKMIKLSLVAAVAVAGLTTTATAGSLEDSIKDTTLKGQVTVGFQNNDYDNAGVADKNQWEYDVDATFTTKVNDMVTSTVGFQADNDIRIDDSAQTTDNQGKASVSGVNLTKAYFTIKTSAVTAMVGKQKIGTPFYDDERADGIVALVPAGPVTLAAAHFTNANSGDLSTEDINAVALLGKFGPASVAAWYVDSMVADAYSVNVKAKVGPASVEFNHAAAELDTAGAKTESLTKLVASVKAGPATVVAAYAMTNDKDGSTARAHGVDMTGDHDAKANFAGKVIHLDDLDDAKAWLIGGSMKVAGATVGAHYISATSDKTTGSNTDATELAVTAKYSMSKNFSVNAYMAKYDAENATTGATDNSANTETQINLSYKF